MLTCSACLYAQTFMLTCSVCQCAHTFVIPVIFVCDTHLYLTCTMLRARYAWSCGHTQWSEQGIGLLLDSNPWWTRHCLLYPTSVRYKPSLLQVTRYVQWMTKASTYFYIHALWHGHTAPLAIEHLQPLDLEPGLWNSLPSHLKEADLLYCRFWQSLKHFCLDIGATARFEIF